MFGALFKLMFVAAGAFLLCFAAGQALRSARRLDRRIARFKAEEQEREEQGRAIHPYAAMAQLYDEEEKPTRKQG